MAVFVRGPDTSSAWVDALGALMAIGGDAVNVVVAIDHPENEIMAVREILDAFIADRRRGRPQSVPLVSTVANTIFPQAWYIERLGVEAEDHLYELETISRPVSRKRNRRGTYFERM